jgi:hypothetical protein
MAVEELPGEIVLLARDEIARRYRRDYQLRIPTSDVGPGTQPYVESWLEADQHMVLHNDARVIGNGTNLSTSRGVWLEGIGDADGVPVPGASVSSGYVTITASVGGTTILVGDELIEPNTSLRFQCIEERLYATGTQVPIASIDTGPTTNLAAGTLLQWTNQRAGCGPNCIVAENSDGSGLSGGRDAASDEEYIEVIKEKRQNPPASGNAAAYRDAVRKIAGLSIEQVWTVPAVKGPGTTAIMFTMKPSELGGSRFANSAQIALVEETLKVLFPGDDGIIMSTILAQPVEVLYEVDWASGAVGWSDYTQWPLYVAADPVRVKASPAPTATAFRLYTSSDTTNPVAGQTVGFFDLENAVFRKKRIKTVTTITPDLEWQIVVETANAASDTSFVPASGDVVSPWSDSLDTIVPPVLTTIGALGPGEQFSTFYDPGLRQKRTPESQKDFPNRLTNLNLLEGVFDVSSVGDVEILEPTLPYETTVGVPGVSSNLITLGGLGVFPQ